MNFLSKKARMNLVAKTLIVTSVLGVSIYIINNQNIINAYATDLGSVSDTTSIAYKKLQIKNRIITELQNYHVDITFSKAEVSDWSLKQYPETTPTTIFFEVLYERPELFWVAPCVVGRTNADGYSYTLYANNIYENADIETKKAELNDKVNGITANIASYSELRKEYEIHDYINENCTYDKSATGTAPTSTVNYSTNFDGYIVDERKVVKENVDFYESHSAYGALIKNKAVCEGYAKSAMILFEKSGMDSGIITGSNHGWNYVQVDGNYYQIDLTWDDSQDKKTVYPYKLFNVSNAQMQKVHDWTSNNVPSCTNTDYDGRFRTVASDGNTISGKPMVRVEDKLYYIEGKKLYSCDLDTKNPFEKISNLSIDTASTVFVWNLVTNNNYVYLLHMSSSSVDSIVIEKIDISNNTIKSVVNINKEFKYTYTGVDIPDFYISNNKIYASVDGTTYNEFSLDGAVIDMVLEQATNAVVKAEGSKLQADVNNARALVISLPSESDKSGLNSRLDTVQQVIDTIKATDEQTLITNATALVVKAESSKTQADVTSAKTLVDVLTDETVKTDLLNRLDSVQQIITDTIKEQLLITDATTSVTKAENSKIQADVDDAKALVGTLPDGSVKDGLNSRLNAVQQIINDANTATAQKLITDATDSVAKAEGSKLQADVDNAKALVGTLPNGSVKDGLNSRLNAVQQIINDSNTATAQKLITNATALVTKAEGSKLQADVDNAKVLVGTLPNGSVKDGLNSRLDSVQQIINSSNTGDAQTLIDNATSLVTKAEGSKTQADVDNAKALVVTLPNGSVKDGLNSRLSAVQQIINDAKPTDAQTLINNATILVTKAESSKTQSDVDSARVLIATMPDGAEKTNLLNALDAIQKSIDDALVVKATDAVAKAEASKLQADVDNAKTLVDTLPNGSVKDGLSGRLNVVQKAITDSKVVNPTDVKISGIAITGSDSISAKGGTLNITTVITPSTATSKTVTWTSSNDSIASVSSSGLVTAKTNGTVTITATANDGSGIKGNKVITVSGQATITTPTNPTDVKITGISITGNDVISTKSGTIALTLNTSPNSATNKAVTWTSSDTGIATVSNTGIVTAIGNGTVVIKATANDGSGATGTKVITISGQTNTNTAIPATSSDSVLKSVSISGTEEVGRTLKSKVKYDGTKPSLEYKWQRASKKDGDYNDISGADNEEYKLKSSDNNKYIKLVITATINGVTYDVEDTTSKIDTASSSDSSSDTSTSSNNSNDNIVVLRPSASTNTTSSGMGEIMPTNESPRGDGIITPNSSSPANGQFTNPSGRPVSGWISSSESWYYLDNGGYAKTGWLNNNGKWYYLSPNTDYTHAKMQTGWIKDNGKWYYLYSDGSMASNTTVSGYQLGANGAWI